MLNAGAYMRFSSLRNEKCPRAERGGSRFGHHQGGITIVFGRGSRTLIGVRGFHGTERAGGAAYGRRYIASMQILVNR